MATSNRPRGTWWSRFHFLFRFLGLTGLLVAVVALTVAWREQILSAWPPVQSWTWEQIQESTNNSKQEITNAAENVEWDRPKIVVTAIVIGVALLLVALVVELLAGLALVSGRRSAFGTNALIQAALAAALLIAVNYYSFGHYHRFDWSHDPQTCEPQFTLPAGIANQLRELKGETLIVVDQRRETFGQNKEKADAYDRAAKRIVVDKVKDLVEQFREFGPQFRVEILDVEKEDFAQQLADLTEDRPALQKALDNAAENSIFFCSPDGQHVQSLSFNDFYQLDKASSKERNNVVLLNQGVKSFADKVLNVEAKRPKVAIAVVHQVLSTEGTEEYNLNLQGLRKALRSRGIDVEDIVLKRWSRFAAPEPAVYSVEDSKLDRLDERLAILDAVLKVQEVERKDREKIREQWKTGTLEQLAKDFAKQLSVTKVTEAVRRNVLEQLGEELSDINTALTENRKRRDSAREERSHINADGLAEQRRVADLGAKMKRLLADCDLLIIPRITLMNLNSDQGFIPYRVHRLEDDAQVDAIKDFLKSGRPVLACFGPANEPRERMSMPESSGPDKVDELFADLGIRFGKQTVLFDTEVEAFAELRANPLGGGASAEVPPLEFEWRTGAGLPMLARERAAADLPTNPLRRSMNIVARSIGTDKEGKSSLLDLRVRHPRPVYFEPRGDKKLAFDPYFLMTSAASWNDDQPFPSRERTPHFERPKNDPDKGTVDEKRRGPFPIGVAVQTTLPAGWYESKATPPTVRVAAIGQGGFFAGSELSPAKEALMLETINWLLGRDEYLPNAEHEWSYPRVDLQERDKQLWHWGTQFALPGLFAYMGLIVLLVRRVR
jgi:hypothetical protein